mgnify:FL=1
MDPKLRQLIDEINGGKAGGRLSRHVDMECRAAEGREGIYELSFSSETPVERWWGIEILDHSRGSVRLDRLNSAGSLLFNHNRDLLIGAIESARIDERARRGRAEVRFSPSAVGQEKRAEVDAGVLRTTSVSYLIHAMVLEKEEDGVQTYRVTDWEPLEVSLVTIPADPGVGVGRARQIPAGQGVGVKTNPDKEETKMDEKEIQKRIDDARKQGGDEESTRVKAILGLVKEGDNRRFADVALRYVETGAGPDEFKRALEELKRLDPKPVIDTDPSIGMSNRDIRQFSIVRAIRAMAEGNRGLAAFEFECSEAVAKRLHKSPQGFFVPYDVLTGRRDLVKGTPTAGGHLVATELLAASFIELLRNKMLLRRLGAQVLGGLVGDIAIPKQTGGATAYWVGENANVTESQQTFGQVALSPRTVGTYTDISRKLLIQSSLDVEAFVRNDLATVLALAIDYAGINGLGQDSSQPLGILQTSGIGAVAIGTDGGAPTWSHIVDLETEVSIDNADVGNLAYLTNAKVRGKLKKTFTNTTYGEIPVWGKGEEPGFGELNGYRAGVSNQVPSNLTKNAGSNLSAIIFGNFSDYIIGEWGAIDILIDPYTGGAAGTVRVRVLQDVDGACRRAESFAAIKDASTT